MKNQNKIYHVIPYNVYGFKFVELLNDPRVIGKHSIIFYSFTGPKTFSKSDYNPSRHKVSYLSKNLFVNWIKLYSIILRSNIVIQHGLFDPRHIVSYNFIPSIKKKLYWVVWGGDLYVGFDNYKGQIFRILSTFRRLLINKIDNLITIFESDLFFFTHTYNKSISWHSPPYNYDLDFDLKIQSSKAKRVKIMVGNNSTLANNHIEILSRLSEVLSYSDEVVTIFLPLSYGDITYASLVSKYAIQLFDKNVEIINEFISSKEYNKLLNQVDIAIMDHDYSAGFGVVLQLLAYGKKVYLKSTNNMYTELLEREIKVFDSFNDFNNLLDPIAIEDAISNNSKLRQLFSRESTIAKWNHIFDS